MKSQAIETVLRWTVSLRGPHRAALVEAVARDGPCTHAMAVWAVDSTLGAFTREAVSQVAGSEAPRGAACGLWLARSVPTAPIRAVARAVLSRAQDVHVRVSRTQPAVLTVLTAAWSAVRSDGDARIHVPARDEPAEVLAAWRALDLSHLEAFGSDEVLARIAAAWSPPRVLRARGHGYGAAVLTTGAASDPVVAEGLALDVCAYDHAGCLSPAFAILVGDDAHALAALDVLHAAFLRVGERLPPPPRDLAASTARIQAIGSVSASALAFRRGPSHALALLPTAVRLAPFGPRMLPLLVASDAARARALLTRVAPWLTTVTLAGLDADAVLPSGFRMRCTLPGHAQTPPFDGPEDPR